MTSFKDFDSIFSNPRDLLEKYVQSRLDVDKDFGCPIDDIISRNIKSESYMRLCNMDTKTLENKFLDMDFMGRYEEKLVNFMNTELKQRVLSYRQTEDPKRKFLLSMSEIHDYLKNTLMFFAPLIRQSDNLLPHHSIAEDVGAAAATHTSKTKRKFSFREKLVADYRTSFTNHLKYCLLDDISYDMLITDFIE
jgi:hypothetical protein